MQEDFVMGKYILYVLSLAIIATTSVDAKGKGKGGGGHKGDGLFHIPDKHHSKFNHSGKHKESKRHHKGDGGGLLDREKVHPTHPLDSIRPGKPGKGVRPDHPLGKEKGQGDSNILTPQGAEKVLRRELSRALID